MSVNNEYAVWRQTGNGVSTQTSLEAIKNVCDTHHIITNLIYNYCNNEETHKICGSYMGSYIFENYPFIKPLLPQIEAYCQETGTKLYFPKRKRNKILKALFGWKIAATIINKYL